MYHLPVETAVATLSSLRGLALHPQSEGLFFKYDMVSLLIYIYAQTSTCTRERLHIRVFVVFKNNS